MHVQTDAAGVELLHNKPSCPVNNDLEINWKEEFGFNMLTAGNVLQFAGAWISTFVFLALYRKLYPNTSLRDYLKKQFTGKIRLKDFLGCLIFFITLLAGTAWTVASVQGKAVFDVLVTEPGVLFITFFWCLIRGPLGEELFWRSFLLNELEKKVGFTKSAIINGLLWGTWHIPLVLFSGYTAQETLIQIICYITAMIALVIIMALLYKSNKNLLIPVSIHQFFNYTVSIVRDETMVSTIALTVFTCIAAVIYWCWRRIFES